ncbi:MAG: lipid-A-disaccharide synthase [Candidatus Thioglobus sp.]|nr:lipid-A-disaccharide synthase [Candidatus Thioglobus sp.]
MKIAISAAETSGDLLGGELLVALKKLNSDITIEGLVGEKMAKNSKQLWNQNRVNVMGFSEVLQKLPALLKLQKSIITHFSKQRPDVFIGVDAPDFNFKIERKLRAQGIKTVHFISPSLWAWRASRVKKIKQSTDLMLCLFPFEVDFYQANNQRAVFVGHPLASVLSPRKNHTQGKNILLLPGSRAAEVKRLLPEMLSAAAILSKQDSALNFHLALANDTQLKWAEDLAQMPLEISTGEAQTQMQQADLAIVASGTATLELALIGVPMVVIYKLSGLSYFIASRLIKSEFISLPNVIAAKKLVPELVQNQANGEQIAEQARQILAADNSNLLAEFMNIYQQLSVNSSSKSARIIYDFINE